MILLAQGGTLYGHLDNPPAISLLLRVYKLKTSQSRTK
jgi:hypothetical protein